jgi:hypothetical protein
MSGRAMAARLRPDHGMVQPGDPPRAGRGAANGVDTETSDGDSTPGWAVRHGGGGERDVQREEPDDALQQRVYCGDRWLVRYP